MAKNAFARKVMTPYTLDAILNTKKPPKKGASMGPATLDSTIALNKKNFEKSNVFYEDSAKGSAAQSSHKLVSAENIQMSEQNRQQAIMGVDPDEPMADPVWLSK